MGTDPGTFPHVKAPLATTTGHLIARRFTTKRIRDIKPTDKPLAPVSREDRPSCASFTESDTEVVAESRRSGVFIEQLP